MVGKKDKRMEWHEAILAEGAGDENDLAVAIYGYKREDGDKCLGLYFYHLIVYSFFFFIKLT